MADAPGHVRPNAVPARPKVSAALSRSWGRVSSGRKGTFADAVQLTSKSVSRALNEETLPELDHALASLLFDPTALDEVLALYGVRVCPIQSEGGAYLDLATMMSGALTEFLQRLADGEICHVDKLALATMFRPLIPQMQAIVDQADRLRGL